MRPADMHVGVVLWGWKLFAVWLVGLALLLAESAWFNPTGILTIAGAGVIIVGTASTLRSKATSFWREEAEAARARAESATAEVLEQRELKHAALNELRALQLKTDLTPILEHLAQLQSNLVQSQDHTRTLEALALIGADLKHQTTLLETQTSLLAELTRKDQS